MTFSVAKLDPSIPSLRRYSGNIWRHLGLPRAFWDSKAYNKSWYKKNRVRQQGLSRKYFQENLVRCRAYANNYNRIERDKKQDFVTRLKTATPCKDCKNFFPACCMDYDHLPGQPKKAGIAVMINNRKYKLPDIEIEISKCELVCANCHRIRTWVTRKNMPKDTSPSTENAFPSEAPASPWNYQIDEDEERQKAMDRATDKVPNDPSREIL
jgi:hypothetical protein